MPQLNQIDKKPIVTILLMTYNSREFILDTLMSIFNQTDQNFLVIINDDHSSDGTMNYIKSVVGYDKRFSYIEAQQNNGLGPQREISIKHVQTEYFMFLDDDDFLYPNAIKKMSKKAIETGSDLITSKMRYYFKTSFGNYTLIPPYFKYSMIKSPQEYYVKNICYFWGYYIKKSYYDTLELDPFIKVYEDFRPVSRIFLEAKTISLASVLGVRYYRRKGSLSSFNDDKLLDRLKIITDEHESLFKYWKIKFQNDPLTETFYGNKMYNLLSIVCMFYDAVDERKKEIILEFIRTNIVDMFFEYGFKLSAVPPAWKQFVYMHTNIIDIFYIHQEKIKLMNNQKNNIL